MSDIVFDLRPYVDPRTKKPQFSACGVPLLEILDWKYGIGTLAVIPPEDNYKAVTNYLQKYVTKDGNIGYCKKRYYRTRNLDFKNKYIDYFTEKELAEFIDKNELEKYKENDKMIVYRKRS